MSFCIFIASRTATTSPSLTSSPVLTGILTISPCIGAVTVPSLDLGREGAATADAAGDPAGTGITARPAPVTRTLNTSPSTSTSNSAVEAAGAGSAGGSAGATGAGSGSGAFTSAGPAPSLPAAGCGPRA